MRIAVAPLLWLSLVLVFAANPACAGELPAWLPHYDLDIDLDVAKPETIIIGRHKDARPSHLRKFLPKLPGETRRIVGIAQLAQMSNGRILCQKTSRIVAKHGLFGS